MTPELCNHLDVERYPLLLNNETLQHCICKSCFEEWVE